jgi:hypothetical protein
VEWNPRRTFSSLSQIYTVRRIGRCVVLGRTGTWGKYCPRVCLSWLTESMHLNPITGKPKVIYACHFTITLWTRNSITNKKYTTCNTSDCFALTSDMLRNTAGYIPYWKQFLCYFATLYFCSSIGLYKGDLNPTECTLRDNNLSGLHPRFINVRLNACNRFTRLFFFAWKINGFYKS